MLMIDYFNAKIKIIYLINQIHPYIFVNAN